MIKECSYRALFTYSCIPVELSTSVALKLAILHLVINDRTNVACLTLGNCVCWVKIASLAVLWACKTSVACDITVSCTYTFYATKWFPIERLSGIAHNSAKLSRVIEHAIWFTCVTLSFFGGVAYETGCAIWRALLAWLSQDIKNLIRLALSTWQRWPIPSLLRWASRSTLRHTAIQNCCLVIGSVTRKTFGVIGCTVVNARETSFIALLAS